MIGVGLSSHFNLFHQISFVSFIDGRKSERAASLSSTAAGLLRDFFKSSSRALNFKKSLRRQGIGRADVSSDHSHPLTVCQRYCVRRRLLPSPSTFAMSVWERLVHPRFTGLSAREARLATPYGQDRHGLHSADAPLRPHRTCRKRGKASPLLFDARFILSRSVVHYVPDTSGEGERKHETVTADVPLFYTPSLTDPQSGIVTFLSCRAYTLQGLQFLRCGYGISAESAEPVTSLVILSCSNPSAYTPSLKPLSPARLTRPKVVAVVLSFDSWCQSRKNRHLSLRLSYRPAPAAPVGLPARLSGRQKERC